MLFVWEAWHGILSFSCQSQWHSIIVGVCELTHSEEGGFRFPTLQQILQKCGCTNIVISPLSCKGYCNVFCSFLFYLRPFFQSCVNVTFIVKPCCKLTCGDLLAGVRFLTKRFQEQHSGTVGRIVASQLQDLVSFRLFAGWSSIQFVVV